MRPATSRSSAASGRSQVPPARSQAATLRKVAGRMDDLVNFLGSRPFFYSEQVSMADLGVYSMIRMIGDDTIQGSAKLLGERPTLLAHMRRVEESTEP